MICQGLRPISEPCQAMPRNAGLQPRQDRGIGDLSNVVVVMCVCIYNVCIRMCIHIQTYSICVYVHKYTWKSQLRKLLALSPCQESGFSLRKLLMSGGVP